jgi:hypothetical protein
MLGRSVRASVGGVRGLMEAQRPWPDSAVLATFPGRHVDRLRAYSDSAELVGVSGLAGRGAHGGGIRRLEPR